MKTDQNGLKSVNYIGLIPHLIEAIKDLKIENAQTIRRVDALEARLIELVAGAKNSEKTGK